MEFEDSVSSGFLFPLVTNILSNVVDGTPRVEQHVDHRCVVSDA